MAAVRTRDRTDAPRVQPRNDPYTVLLIISLAAMIVGCVFLLLDFNQYPSGKPAPPPAVQPGRAAPGATPGAGGPSQPGPGSAPGPRAPAEAPPPGPGR